MSQNYTKSLLVSILCSSIYFVGYKLDVAFFQVLSWIINVPVFILCIIGLFLAKKHYEKIAPTAGRKVFMIAVSFIQLACNLWITNGSQLFWLILFSSVISFYSFIFIIPTKKEE